MSSGVRDVRRGGSGVLQVARVRRSGLPVRRVLLVGGSSLARPEGQAAAAEALADELQSTSGAGVDLDVLWDLRPALDAMSAITGTWRGWPYDAVVIVLPPPTSRLASGRGTKAVARSVQRAVLSLMPLTRVAVVSTGGRSHSYAAPDVELPSVGDLRIHPPFPVDLAAVFDELTGAAEPGHELWRVRDQDEAARHRALTATGALDAPLERRLNQVVEMARNSFGVDGAMVNLLDSDTLWTVAGAGAPAGRQPRHGTLCNETLRRADVTVFGDTWALSRFDGNPIMHGAVPLRFYAGHPVESVDGCRIGTLCVYDAAPHDPEEFDLSMLRDLALLAEGEVLSATTTGAAV